MSLFAARAGPARASTRATKKIRRITATSVDIIAPGPGRPGTALSSARDREVGAPIPGPRALVVARIDRPLLPIGRRPQPVRGHAQAGQVVAGDLRALVPQREVVLHGPTLVAVALDHDLGLAVVLHPERVLLQGRAGFIGERGLVVVEMDVGQRAALAGGS